MASHPGTGCWYKLPKQQCLLQSTHGGGGGGGSGGDGDGDGDVYDIWDSVWYRLVICSVLPLCIVYYYNEAEWHHERSKRHHIP